MKRIHIIYCMVAILFSTAIHAQIVDNFNDGNFTANPVWVGNTTDFVVNTNNQLQSNNTTVNGNYYLVTANTLATTTQWEMAINLTLNTSSTNYVDVYITASASDILATTTTGYFVRLGGTTDEISLYKKLTGGTITKIIDGVDGILNTSNNTLKLKVIRDAANVFTLYRDITGTGNSYTSEGSIIDATYTTSSFFGIAIKQSTASFFQRHFFDDIDIKAYTPDITPPTIISTTALSINTIDVLFNEPVDAISSQVAANYVANNAIGAATTAIIDGGNNALVHLSFLNNFANGIINTLTINGVQDMIGNTLNNGVATFFFYTPQPYDIVIDELIADPTPQLGLPNSEWIELKNTAAFAINLQGWKIGDANGLSGALPNFILQPDSFVIVTTSSAVAALSAFSTTLSVTNFPSLDNIGELLYVQSNRNQIIHSVQYNVSWYQNELKQDGGWSLEMIDTKNPCSGSSNWQASTNLLGGTPGKKNAVDAINQDNIAPTLLRAYTTNNSTIVLVFDEPLDSVKAATANNYSVSDGISMPTAAACIAPSFTKVSIQLSSPLQLGKVYTISCTNITDCKGNTMGTKNKAKVGISSVADSLDIVINEILFNPPSNGSDYVEIYNRSKKIIDLNKTYIANRNTAGTVSSIALLSTEPALLFPEDFLVITENTAWVKNNYITLNPDAFITIPTMPSYNDDAGNVIILNAQGKITDEVAYKDSWHFTLIDNVESVSLERIDYNAASNYAENWHSAATSVNYGTPTYKNSQYRINDGVQGQIKVSPAIVSPDNDGQDDFGNIDYQFNEPGNVANITIFDGYGRPVRFLQRNAICGTSGTFRWDGLGEKSKPLAIGVYIVVTEIFNVNGKKKQFKNTIVIARRS